VMSGRIRRMRRTLRGLLCDFHRGLLIIYYESVKFSKGPTREARDPTTPSEFHLRGFEMVVEKHF
jgi:hypothetical protein